MREIVFLNRVKALKNDVELKTFGDKIPSGKDLSNAYLREKVLRLSSRTARGYTLLQILKDIYVGESNFTQAMHSHCQKR